MTKENQLTGLKKHVMNYNYINKLFKNKHLVDIVMNELNISKCNIMTDTNIEFFWELFKKKRDKKKVKPDQWLTPYEAGKQTGVERRAIKSLAERGLIRSKEMKNKNGAMSIGVALPDVLLLAQLKNFFEDSLSANIVKVTEMTGQKKYLMLDFQKSNQGKTILEYQMEIFVKAFNDFFSNYYDLVPKNLDGAPENLDERLKK